MQKETGSIGQDMAQNGQNGISDDDKKIDAMWEKMNEGVPKRTFRTFSSKPSSNVMRTSQKISNVRILFVFSAFNAMV